MNARKYTMFDIKLNGTTWFTRQDETSARKCFDDMCKFAQSSDYEQQVRLWKNGVIEMTFTSHMIQGNKTQEMPIAGESIKPLPTKKSKSKQ